MTQKYRRRDLMGLVYVFPWVLGFLVLQLYPFINSLLYSFANFSLHRAYTFLGFENYTRLFTVDPDFYNSLSVTFRYTFLTVPGKILSALMVALLLNMNLRGINFLRTVYYLPSLLGGSMAVATLWRLMFMSQGIVNNVLGIVGIPGIEWLGDPKFSLLTISLLEIWQFGSSMVLFLAALKQVPGELYESAQIDGANRIRIFFSITLPTITPILFFNIIMQTITALQNFTSVFVITNGGPLKSTYVLGMKLYTEAFRNFNMGYASAISWVIFIIIMFITIILFRSSSSWVFYSDSDKS